MQTRNEEPDSAEGDKETGKKDTKTDKKTETGNAGSSINIWD